VVDIPLSSEEPLPVINITFEGSCSHDIYLESQSQNSLNQFADGMMKVLAYEIVHPVTQSPFEFVSVDAFPIDGERIQILWQTKNEFNGGYFEIEKILALDFLDYSVISSEKALNLGIELNNYQYIEDSKITSVAFYRLKYIDMDGVVEYSETVKVKRGDVPFQVQMQASIFPNPTADVVTLLLDGKEKQQFRVTLSDLNGKELIKENIGLDNSGKAELMFDLSAFPQAIYVVKVSDTQNTEDPQSIRVVKK
jgi:hypothetical protein